MTKRSKKILTASIIISIILVGVGVIMIVVKRRKKTAGLESVSQSVVSGVSSVVTSGYVKESFPLKKGMYGDNVKTLQKVLIYTGHSVGSTGADGKFGANTLKAVQSYFKDSNKTQVTQSEFDFLKLQLTGTIFA